MRNKLKYIKHYSSQKLKFVRPLITNFFRENTKIFNLVFINKI
jgi:hypothetical protein